MQQAEQHVSEETEHTNWPLSALPLTVVSDGQRGEAGSVDRGEEAEKTG